MVGEHWRDKHENRGKNSKSGLFCQYINKCQYIDKYTLINANILINIMEQKQVRNGSK